MYGAGADGRLSRLLTVWLVNLGHGEWSPVRVDRTVRLTPACPQPCVRTGIRTGGQQCDTDSLSACPANTPAPCNWERGETNYAPIGQATQWPVLMDCICRASSLHDVCGQGMGPRQCGQRSSCCGVLAGTVDAGAGSVARPRPSPLLATVRRKYPDIVMPAALARSWYAANSASLNRMVSRRGRLDTGGACGHGVTVATSRHAGNQLVAPFERWRRPQPSPLDDRGFRWPSRRHGPTSLAPLASARMMRAHLAVVTASRRLHAAQG